MSRMNRLGRAKAHAKRKEIMGPSGGIRECPRTVQLPGGLTLSAMPFVITSYTDEGAPRTFEILPHGQDPAGEHGCVLFAHEEWIRGANQKYAKPATPESVAERGFDEIHRSIGNPLAYSPAVALSDEELRAKLIAGRDAILASGEIVDDGE